ncbi:MAG: hypothetical protein IPH57_05675 [Saprospiraceae bacterium]|nr:hypothetical protein [Saprospiraceae bacterium]
MRQWNSLVKAVDNVMQNYPVNHSSPYNSGNGFNGGVSHGLTFTDILERMYFHTHDNKYLEYAFVFIPGFFKYTTVRKRCTAKEYPGSKI